MVCEGLEVSKSCGRQKLGMLVPHIVLIYSRTTCVSQDVSPEQRVSLLEARFGGLQRMAAAAAEKTASAAEGRFRSLLKERGVGSISRCERAQASTNTTCSHAQSVEWLWLLHTEPSPPVLCFPETSDL